MDVSPAKWTLLFHSLSAFLHWNENLNESWNEKVELLVSIPTRDPSC